MPELPEVENIAENLRACLIGNQLTQVWRSPFPLRKHIELDELSSLCGNKVCNIRRVGKYMIFEFSNGTSMVSHLGMSGRYTIAGTPIPKEKHCHIVFSFDPRTHLHYIDPRRFGFVATYSAGYQQSFKIPDISSLGKDPLNVDFTSAHLRLLLRKSKKPIKAFLLDQHKVPGLGNIYATEALFLSGIHPEKIAGTLSLQEIERLFHSIVTILTDAIWRGGTTLSDGGYRNAFGRRGEQQDYLQVYGKKGASCNQCGTKIEHFFQGQRSTYFCPVCQPK